MVTFEDERDERAWVAFAAGYREVEEHYTSTGGNATRNEDSYKAACFADSLLLQLRQRRAKGAGGPYRTSGI